MCFQDVRLTNAGKLAGYRAAIVEESRRNLRRIGMREPAAYPLPREESRRRLRSGPASERAGCGTLCPRPKPGGSGEGWG
jgi:hypothetical protein